MAKPVIQHSFNSGEWAPNLYARTDMDKYGSGAALLRNFFVDYRGGATTRSGTKYVLKGYKDATAIRLIPFQASISLGFVLEFGNTYIRFHRNGAPVLESTLNITGINNSSTCVVTVGNTYTTGDVDWIYITGVVGMPEINNKYYIIHSASPTTVVIYDLFGVPINSTAFGTYVSGGTTARVYTIASPYAASDLALLKFVQNIGVLVLTHPSYAPRTLTYTSPTSWVIATITFGPSITQPSNVAITSTLPFGGYYYSYIVVAVDENGEESNVSSPAALNARQDFRTTAGNNTITWDPIQGAASYNVYRSYIIVNAPVALGAPYGFVGNTTALSLQDTNIAADYSQPPPTTANPFAAGAKVISVLVTNSGGYTGAAPTVTFSAPSGGGVTATGTPLLRLSITPTVAAGGAGYAVSDTLTLPNGIILSVVTVAVGAITSVIAISPGSASVLPANPVGQVATSGAGTGATFNLTWGVYAVAITNGGSGYVDPSNIPTITFSAGTAAATAGLGPASVGNPSVATFYGQRLVLAAPTSAPNTLYLSQPGNYYNYNISSPSQDDDAITAPIVLGQLVNIKALIPQPGGLIVLTDGISFLVNGGSLGAPVAPSTITANAQSFIGANDMPPIVVNFDILSVPSKGSSVRDNTYNFQTNVFMGQDISIMSSHLFFGYTLTEWAWAEEPYKTVWAVRNDGTLLSLTFIKEQEFVAWTHHDTEGGSALFKSVCSIVESATSGYQNYTYHVIQRTIGAFTVKYIEYFPERGTSSDPQDYTTVDCSISYAGSPATTFRGGEFLAGKTCTGLADGTVITPFVMPASGTFTLPSAKSEVTVGLAFTAQLQTLYIDLGNPTVQSKEKKIPSVTVRVTATLGLKIGSDSSNLTIMKDLVVGQVGSMTNAIVSGLVTGDANTVIDPRWQEAGQFFIQQDTPFPATVLGLIPSVQVEDQK